MMSATKSKDGYRQLVFDLVQQATQRKHMIAYPTVLVELLGDHVLVALLMQMLYWSGRTKDPEGWFYKSYTEWQQELGLSEYQVRRCLDGDARTKAERITLRDLGVTTKRKRAGQFGAPVLHYRVDCEVLKTVLAARLELHRASEQCAGSIPNNVEVTTLTLSGIEGQQSGGALSDTEITNPEITSENIFISIPTPHPDDDSNFEPFKSYEKRFGKAKEGLRAELLAQLERLGTLLVTEVLARCAQRGRSWYYVLRALANETAPLVAPQNAYSELYTQPDPLEVLAEIKANTVAVENDLPTTEQVYTAIGSSTAAAIWNTAAQQLELQLDRHEFETWLKGAQLVDFAGETCTFVIAVPNIYARDYCQNRLYRTLRRAVEDAASRAGQGIALQFITREEWLKREIVAA